MKVRLLIAFLTFTCFCCLGENNAQIPRQHPPVVSEGEQTHTKLQQENCALKAVIQKLEQERIILRNNIDALSKQIVALKENNIAYQDTIAILKKNNGLYAARIEELNRCIQEQNKKILELEKRLADSLEVVKQLQIQLNEKNATLRDKQEEYSTILKGVLDKNKALKNRNTLLNKKNKLYISLFYAILLLVILWIIAKVVHQIKRFTFRDYKSLEADFIEHQTMDSKKEEEITIVDSSADNTKKLKCPRCGWKYNPGDNVCKNCKTIF